MRHSLKRYFLWPIITSVVLFAYTWYSFGVHALILVGILSVLEVTLSFDNAVVNARVLKKMSAVWQQRFLTWGILVAVVGTRFVLPILIVSVALWVSPYTVAMLALYAPEEYSAALTTVHGTILAFGGMFLLMVSLKYFFNKAKTVHWIHVVERHLVKWGRIEAIELALALTALVTLSFGTHYERADILVAGLVGLILFIIMEGVASSLSVESDSFAAAGVTLFIYLNILDSAFSLDGVVGAFALTNNLVLIMIGLGIGAYFVRSMTMYFVKENTLTKLVYLEHGAHWAIAGLALAMLLNLVFHIPEILIGGIGLCFVLLAYRSSRRATL